MNFRKLYVKSKLFLYSRRHIINALLITAMSAVLIGMFVNSFIFEKLVINQAATYAKKEKYKKAIQLYDVAYVYYKLFHFGEVNKEIYFEIPYKQAQCYLLQNNREKSITSMLNGITSIQNEYGIFSRETATFMRKYLIEYYLDNKKLKLATQEFNNLLVIYKKITYNASEQADLIRICGDLYYAEKHYDMAVEYYQKAYKSLVGAAKPEYGVLAKIVTRIANYEIANKREDIAANLYDNAINIIKIAPKRNHKYAAILLMDAGDLNIRRDNDKAAIIQYEEALEIIRKLPKTNYMRQNIDTYYNTLKGLYQDSGQFHKVREVDMILDREKRFNFLR